MVTDINNINAPQPGKPNGGGSAPQNDSRSVSPTVPSSQPASNASDTVELSSQAQNLNRIKEDLRSQPEVDEARVSEVQEKIASGQYRIDAEQIAAQILVNEQDF